MSLLEQAIDRVFEQQMIRLRFFLALALTLAPIFSAFTALSVKSEIEHPIHIESAKPKKSDREIAARFAPVFYQALGDKPRSDFITNFDFDGDWRGDNNWQNVDNTKFALKAYIYYCVAETKTHLFIHYAVFHPRDYKGGEVKGTILSDLIREGAKRGGQYDPTGLSEEAALAHENDLEGCVVVVAKNEEKPDRSKVVFVETLHHNNFARYIAGEDASGFERLRFDDQRANLYVEPKGHGIEAFQGTEKQVARKEFVLYRFSGSAQDPGDSQICRNLQGESCHTYVGYDLLPIETTLWQRAQGAPNPTYGQTFDYGNISLSLQEHDGRKEEKTFTIGKIGCAFLGRVGGYDMARPPWGWFDLAERDKPLGGWFFDPATTIKRDFHLDESFSTSYIRAPFWAEEH